VVAGDDLDAETAAELAWLLDGVREILRGITAKIEAAGP
jgi:hypothetical protein